MPTFAIVADGVTPEQREAMHEAIKAASHRGWWHHFGNLWIVRGLSATEWRNTVREPVRGGAASVVVLKIDTDDSGTWAWFGANAEKACRWLHDYL